MPAMHLISVLLPAPLSPPSAVTRPEVTSRSTSRSTCTAPKLLLIPRRLSSGPVDDPAGTASCVVVDTVVFPSSAMTGDPAWLERLRGGRARPARGRTPPPSSGHAVLRAQGGVGVGADLVVARFLFRDDFLYVFR